MTQSGTGEYQTHYFRRVVPGDIETVRRRLSDALEEFNYIVLGEQPLQARRNPQKSMLTANVLEYDIRLTIALKSVSPVSTVATFNYEVPYLFTKGEKRTLEREGEAIIALAIAPLSKSVCPACGAENTGAIRFCRACGTPVSRSGLPTELEVLRLTSAASGAQQEFTIGIAMIVLTLAITLPMILLGGGKVHLIGWILFAIGDLLSSFFLAFGLTRLHRALRPAAQEPPVELTGSISTSERAALPPRPASVTEGTTELMEEEKMPAAVRDTGDMD